MDTHIGKQMGNYHLTRLLGWGSFADVYLGQHVYLNAPAAIKVLKKGLAKDHVQQFINEARTLKQLTHPHIVHVLDFGITEDGIPYLAMDYAPNGTLRQLHPKGTQVPLDLILSYVKQVADALQYAHDQKKIHRDVKPENMLLSERSEVLLSDFGLVEIVGTSMSQMYSTENMSTKNWAGTPVYMPPEQFRGRSRPASDQYALGIVVYEWLNGTPPFVGSAIALMYQHRNVIPPTLQKDNTSVTAEVEAVVMQALAKDPQQRFASVREFAQALEKAHKKTALPSQDQRFIPTYVKIVSKQQPLEFQTVKQTQNNLTQQLFTPTKTQQKDQFLESKRENNTQNPGTVSEVITSNQSLQHAIDTFPPKVASSQDLEGKQPNAQRDWYNLKWVILIGAIMTSVLFPIGILFQIPIITALSLIPLTICIIPGLFQTAHYDQWYWFTGFVVLCPLVGILYSVIDPEPKQNLVNNLKQLIVLLASLGYAFIAVAIFMNSWPPTSNVNTWWIYYLGLVFMLSSWLLGFIRTARQIGFGEWIMVFFFPLSAPFAGIISIYSKDFQPEND